MTGKRQTGESGVLGIRLAFWGSNSLLALMVRGRSPVSLSVHILISPYWALRSRLPCSLH
jgi:hypothetical protein